MTIEDRIIEHVHDQLARTATPVWIPGVAMHLGIPAAECHAIVEQMARSGRLALGPIPREATRPEAIIAVLR